MRARSREHAPDHPERQQDRADDHRPFDEDVIAPMFRKRRVRFGHRAISQVVPSLESLMTTPIAASSSRMRSDSLKSFRARAAARTSNKVSTLAEMLKSADSAKTRSIPNSSIAAYS